MQTLSLFIINFITIIIIIAQMQCSLLDDLITIQR